MRQPRESEQKTFPKTWTWKVGAGICEREKLEGPGWLMRSESSDDGEDFPSTQRFFKKRSDKVNLPFVPGK